MKTFFKVPLKVHHGLLIVAALAEQYGGDPVPLDVVAKSARLSQGFLEEVAASLRAAKLITGKRGPRGGYVLARTPEELTVADVIAAIEGPVTVVDCMKGGKGCLLATNCRTKSVWDAVQSQIMKTLSRVTIDDLVARGS